MKRKYGQWRKLTLYLATSNKKQIKLTDDEMQTITGSIDKNKPYNIDFTPQPQYSIKRRAADAGYEVDYVAEDRSTKIFTKMK